MQLDELLFIAIGFLREKRGNCGMDNERSVINF